MLRRPLAALVVAAESYCDRIVCVCGAILAAQAPEFIQQYLQRLGGHLDEAQRQLAAFHSAAIAAGKGWGQFVADTAGNPDPGLAKLGHTMADSAARAEHLAAAYAALREASVWSKPWAFLTHFDAEIAHATAGAFKPAVPTTAEGATYAVAGVTVALVLWYLLVRLPLRRRFSGKKAQ
jgi:hypothetical protein